MQCSSRARRNRLAALGMLLCLLAAVFAVEAKIGWYSSDSTARVELSASKLRGDDAPKLLTKAESFPAPAPELISPAVVLATLAMAIVAVFPVELSPAPQKFGASFGTVPPLFFRPPPRAYSLLFPGWTSGASCRDACPVEQMRKPDTSPGCGAFALS